MLFTELHELPDGFAWDFQLRNNQVRGDDDVARSLNHLRCDVIIGRLGADQEVFTGVSFDQVQRCPSVGMRHFDEVIEVSSGRPVSAERLGHREFAIHRRNPTF